MISFLWTTVSIILVTLTISLRCEDKYEVLHFTRNIPRMAVDVVLMEKLKLPSLMHPIATACSATYEKEDAFNEQNSLSKNSLFVRKTYEKDQAPEDVEYYVCENHSKLSVLYHTKDIEFIFGFEIYYDKSQYADKGFIESNRGDYDLITNTHAYTNYIKALLPYIPGVRFLPRMPSIPVVSRFLQTPLYLDDEHKKEMGFLWLDSFRMKFNFKAQRVAYAIYGLYVTTRGLHECADYDLGKAFFNGFEVKNLYLAENQKRMLAGVKLPKPESDDNYKETACESENQCFAKWSLVPAESFHYLITGPTSCSDLLTVPIWKSTIYDVLTKLDNFLFALSIVIGHPVGDIMIHSGVQGVLQLPTDLDERRTKSITLTEKGIQVPDVIYKFIKYTTKECEPTKNTINKNDDSKSPESKLDDDDDKNDESKAPKSGLSDNGGKVDESKTAACKFATSAIIVIIHNNPNFNSEKDQICKDECDKLGWEIIKERKLSEEIIKSKYIYCCQANDPDVRKKLNIKYDVAKAELGVQYSSARFSLKAVPMYNTDTEQFELLNVHDLVVKAYKKLFEGTERERIQKDEWDKFMTNYHVKMSYFQIEAPKNDGVEPDNAENEQEDKEETDQLISENAELGGEK